MDEYDELDPAPAPAAPAPSALEPPAPQTQQGPAKRRKKGAAGKIGFALKVTPGGIGAVPVIQGTVRTGAGISGMLQLGGDSQALVHRLTKPRRRTWARTWTTT